MPLYVFRCNQCCTEFERLLSLHDDQSAVRCPECEADVKRVVTACASPRGKRSEAVSAPGGG